MLCKLNNPQWNYTTLIFLFFFFFKFYNLLFVVCSFFFKIYSGMSLKIVISPQLLIGWNVIHPPLFYLGIFFFFLKIHTGELKFFITHKIGFFTSTFALLLGGWWGWGNSSWGFFWVNDAVEIILFVVILVYLTNLHVFWLKINKHYNILILLMVLVSLLVLRWGFVFTRHNFFNLNSLHSVFFIFFINLNRWLGAILFISFNLSHMYLVGFIFILVIVSMLPTLYRFKKMMVIGHIIFLIIAMLWLKHRANLYTVFTVFYPNYVGFLNLFVYYKNYTLFWYTLLKAKIFLIKTQQFFVANLKLIKSAYTVYSSYSIFIFLFFFIISIIKISFI